MPDTPAPTRNVPTRRIDFEPAIASLERHPVADGDLCMSHFVAALSGLFPDGEEFFVRSVRHFRAEITDPVLRRDVAGFIGQEATHGREHRVLNDRLAALGYPTKRVERFVDRSIRIRERLLSPTSNLAATAALEHFTATLAELVLTDVEARAMFGDGLMRDLFTWHALEESEHKAVAFDVYRAVGGSERTRVLTMKIIRVVFITIVTVIMAGSLLGDPEARRRPRQLMASWRRFRRSPLFSAQIRAQLHEYDRAGFHPDDRDTTTLVAGWRDRLFGEDGTLTDRLLGQTA